ncbi:hypothetical protein OUZ56_003991 [Daphnia magna]|uniref:Uncharacterized protein n=1 Tax=Daphnia magna TaxID=35525 RepID=A0ABQ9YNF6_9CRUS|nr:hypothetical protein OUZ56_003991 [Daphnia magna]
MIAPPFPNVRHLVPTSVWLESAFGTIQSPGTTNTRALKRVVVFGDKCGVSFPTSQRHGIGMSDQLDAILDDKWTGIIFSAEKRAFPTALFLSVMTKSRGEREKWGCFGVCMSLAASEGARDEDVRV